MNKVLRESTVKATVIDVQLAFRPNLRPDLVLDVDANMPLFLSRQISGYVDADPSAKQEKSLSLLVFRAMLANTFTP